MFASNFHFKEILEWFCDSQFEYLILFLPSRDTRDRKIDDYIIRNQASIDELTGRNIAYISYTEMDLPNEIKHVKKHQLPPNAIRTHVYISDEACDYYSFGHYKLPALILISKQLEYKLFPIASETDLDSYFAPIGIITSFLGDYHRVKWNKNRFKSLENDKKRKIEECSRLSEENFRLEKTFELKDDEELATRIDNNYCRLFNHLKAKKVKQNTFENVFLGNLDENEIINKLDKLGIDEELHKYALELINDLKKVSNFKKFQAQYGNAAQQIKRLIHLCDQEINDNNERIEKLTNEISDIEKELLVAPEKLMEYDEELNEIKRVWSNKLNNNLFIDNGMEILSNALDGYSNVLIDILTTVNEKSKKNNGDNIHVEETDNIKVFRNGEYDVFISYSRKDSEQVLSVVRELQKRGFTTWIDKDGIESGDAFKSVIVRAIKNSDVFLFFSSKDSNKSPWTVKEVNTAVHLKKSIIPIKLDDADYDDSILFDLVGLDFVDVSLVEKRELALKKLINTLASKIIPKERNKTDANIVRGEKQPMDTDTSNAEGQNPDQVSQVHSIGEIMMLGKQKGIVFYLDESRQHGKIISTDSSIKQWCSRNEYLAHRDTMSVSDDNGMANLRRIQQIPDWDLLYPAFKWCAKKGDAWYLPTIEDYHMIDKQRGLIFDKINDIDEKGWFWSSEQESVYSAKYYHFLSGQAHGLGKDNECNVLAVAEF